VTMAFVSDFNEEDLQKALAAQGAPVVSSGPGAAAGPAGLSGPAVPQVAAPASAPGGDPQGTGFVNLSRYYGANEGGADAMARGVVDRLKVDPSTAGKDAADKVPEVPGFTPEEYQPEPRGGYGGGGSPVREGYGRDEVDARNAQGSFDYAQALAKHAADMEKARKEAEDAVRSGNLEEGRKLITDPNALAGAMNKDGRNPSAFDSYLTGGAIGGAYQGLRDYYGVGGDRANPPTTPAPGDPRETPPPGGTGRTGPRVQPSPPGGGEAPADPGETPPYGKPGPGAPRRYPLPNDKGENPSPPFGLPSPGETPPINPPQPPISGLAWDPQARKKQIGGW
jgi:hypothetical protein